MAHLDAHLEKVVEFLSDSAAKRVFQVQADFLVTPEEGPKLHGWDQTAMPKAVAAPTGATLNRYADAARSYAKTLFKLLSPGESSNTAAYAAKLQFTGDTWRSQEIVRLILVEPVEGGTPGTVNQSTAAADVALVLDEDDPVGEVRRARQVVLSNAAILIAEQNPARLDNLLTSAAPFMIGHIRKLGGLARMAKTRRMPTRLPAFPLYSNLRGSLQDPGLIDEVMRMRRELGMRRADFWRNIAVARVRVDGRYEYVGHKNISKKDTGAEYGFHSEAKLIEKIQADYGGRKYVIEEIFSERIPCANCKAIIKQWSKISNVEPRVFYAVSEVHWPQPKADTLMRAYGLE